MTPSEKYTLLESMPKDDCITVRPLHAFAIVAVLVALLILPALIGNMMRSKAEELKQSAAEQSELLKMKHPIRMASEQAILATIWEKTQ
jgi:uncharacterized membrane protein